ncbi:hypothetical protein EOM86_01150 [Candidatus Nomurabacteria bacterium]|nr:hypothetical protein [Candidatus Nomurabacteria bacterium]
MSKEHMTRQEALETLGVNEHSLRTDVETRYATLVKRYRSEQNNEKLEEISLAYNIITGRYVEPVEDTPEMKKVTFGKTRKEWSNIWLYNKYKYLAIVVGSAFLIYMIVTIITNKPGDFKLAAVGDFYIPDSELVSDYVLGLFDEFERVDVTYAQVSSREGQTGIDAAGEQKAMILLTVSGEDIIVVDRNVFDRYAGMGAYVALDDLFDEVSDHPEAAGIGLEAVKAAIEEEGVSGPEHVYGISLGESQLLNGIGVYGREQILTISIKSERPDTAKEFIRKLIRDSENVLPQVTPIVTAAPTPSPTPSPSPAQSD